MRNKRKLITAVIIAAVVVVSSVMVGGVVWLTNGESNNQPTVLTDVAPVESNPLELIPLNVNNPKSADTTAGVFFTPGVDIMIDGGTQTDTEIIDTSFKILKEKGFNSAYIVMNANNKSLIGSELFDHILTTAKANSLYVYPVINIFNDKTGKPISAEEYVASDFVVETANQLLISGADGIYFNTATTALPKAASADLATQISEKITLDCAEIHKFSNQAYLGLMVDAVAAQSLEKGVNTLALANAGLFNCVIVNNDKSTKDETTTFDAVNKQWKTAITDTNVKLTINLSATKTAAAAEGFKSPDQLSKQMVQLKEASINSFTFDSAKAFINDKTGSTAAVLAYMSGKITSDLILTELTLTSPEKATYTTSESQVNIIGGSDPTFPVKLNGKDLETTDKGFFTTTVDLKSGSNKYTLEHKDKTINLDITYKKTVMNKVAPNESQEVVGNSQISVNATALKGSNITATLNGNTINLVEQAGSDSDSDAAETTQFVPYSGTLTVPMGQVGKSTELGPVTFTGSNNGTTQNATGGNIVVAAEPEPVVSEASSSSSESQVSTDSASASATSGGTTAPTGPMGPTGLVGEVNVSVAETLDGDILDERSRPTNSYLPAGTVDYVGANDILLFNTDGTTTKFRKMSYGDRVYSEDIKMYEGSLPTTNALSVESVSTNGRHDIVKLNTQWKAPFGVLLGPQTYKNPYPSSGRPDYSISSPTYDYVDIKFAYANSGSGSMDLGGSPVFSSAEWLAPADKSTTLRLHLRNAGEFYGWDAEYDSEGHLVFSFLHPADISNGSLAGTVIMLDPGHGGKDVGALGSNKAYSEAKLNLDLSFKIKEKLEARGAEVIMTRTDDTFISLEERSAICRKYKPDIFISVHRNSSTNASANGYEDYYYNPYSKSLATSIYNTAAPVFNTKRGTQFYPFYVTRATSCPAVLLENGFVSNAEEFSRLCDPAYDEKIADATVKGIEDYFASIQ